MGGVLFLGRTALKFGNTGYRWGVKDPKYVGYEMADMEVPERRLGTTASVSDDDPWDEASPPFWCLLVALSTH